jgi:hypothetical protein
MAVGVLVFALPVPGTFVLGALVIAVGLATRFLG